MLRHRTMKGVAGHQIAAAAFSASTSALFLDSDQLKLPRVPQHCLHLPVPPPPLSFQDPPSSESYKKNQKNQKATSYQLI